jgi:hypothetical protein
MFSPWSRLALFGLVNTHCSQDVQLSPASFFFEFEFFVVGFFQCSGLVLVVEKITVRYLQVCSLSLHHAS